MTYLFLCFVATLKISICIPSVAHVTIKQFLQQGYCNSIANAVLMLAGVTETSAKCRLNRFLWSLFSLQGYSALLLFVYRTVVCD